MSRVVVVGAGISGLAAAHALLAAGAEVTVLESSGRVGGKLQVSEIAGLAVDEGAETFLRRRPEGLDLVEAVRLGEQLVSPATSRASVWARGRLRPLPARTVLGIPSEPASLAGILSAAEVARVRLDRWLPGSAPRIDVSVGDWVGRRLGRAVVDRLVDPLLGGVYAGRADELSVEATLPQLPRDRRSLLAAARQVAGAAPTSTDPVFATLTAGLGTLPSAVAQAVTAGGGVIVTGRAVRRLERAESGWRVVHGATIDEQAVDADAVVVAVPAYAAARLLAPVAPTAGAGLAEIEAASVAIVTTAWRNSGRTGSGASGYLVPAVYRRPVKAVTFSSTKWAHLSRPDLMVARCSIGRHGDVADLQHDDADLVAAAVIELTTYAGFEGQPIESRVTRWGGGLPQYAVGHVDRVARIRSAVAAVPGLAVCGASYDGIGIPACIATGQQAAAQILESLRSRESR